MNDRSKSTNKLSALESKLLELLKNITKEQTFPEFETNVHLAREFVKDYTNG